jgi:hypothetical protein
MYFSHTGHSLADSNGFLFSIPVHQITFHVWYLYWLFHQSFQFHWLSVHFSPSLPLPPLSPSSLPPLSVQVSADPFRVCKIPTIFVVGSEGQLSSIDYIEVSCTCPLSRSVIVPPFVFLHGINLTTFGIKFRCVFAAPPSQSQSSATFLGWGGEKGYSSDSAFLYIVCSAYYSLIDCRGSACTWGFPAHAKDPPPTRKPHYSWIPFLGVNYLPF